MTNPNSQQAIHLGGRVKLYEFLGIVGSIAILCGLWLSHQVWDSSSRSWLRRGYAAYVQGDYADAEVAFRRALAADSSRTDAYEPLAQTLYQQQRFAEARNFYQKALPTVPVDHKARVWLAAGNTELQLGHLPAAAHAYRQSLIHQPGYRPAQQNLSWVLLKISEKNKKTPFVRNIQSAQKKPDTPSSEEEKQSPQKPDSQTDTQADAQNSQAASQIRNEQQLSQSEMNQLLKQLDNAEKQLRGRPTQATAEKQGKAEVKDW